MLYIVDRFPISQPGEYEVRAMTREQAQKYGRHYRGFVSIAPDSPPYADVIGEVDERRLRRRTGPIVFAAGDRALVIGESLILVSYQGHFMRDFCDYCGNPDTVECDICGASYCSYCGEIGECDCGRMVCDECEGDCECGGGK